MKKYQLIIGAILSCCFCCLFSANANATVEVQISPTRSETFELDNNQTATGFFVARNIGDEAFDLQYSVTPYNVIDQNNNNDLATVSNYNKIIDWITVNIEQTHLEPGESSRVNYSITAPDNLPGGGQYATIAISGTTSEKATGNITIVNRVAYVISAHTTGETIEEGKILDNYVPSFLFGSKIYATSLVENTGNIDVAVNYEFTVSTLAGEDVYTNITSEDTGNRIVFPENEYYSTLFWEGSPQLGIFKVSQTVTFLDQVSTAEGIVFVCPFWLIIIFGIFIICMIIWLINNYLNRKNRKGRRES